MEVVLIWKCDTAFLNACLPARLLVCCACRESARHTAIALAESRRTTDGQRRTRAQTEGRREERNGGRGIDPRLSSAIHSPQPAARQAQWSIVHDGARAAVLRASMRSVCSRSPRRSQHSGKSSWQRFLRLRTTEHRAVGERAGTARQREEGSGERTYAGQSSGSSGRGAGNADAQSRPFPRQGASFT